MKRSRRSLVLALIAGLSLHAAKASAQTVNYIETNEDGSAVVELSCALAAAPGPNGVTTYQMLGPCGSVQSIALTRNPNVTNVQKPLLSGQIYFKNVNSVKKLYSLVLELPFPEHDVKNLKVGGFSQRFFKTDANGGTINSIMGTPGMLQFLVDAKGVDKAWIFPPPSQASNSGQSQQTTNYFFGQNVGQQNANAILPSEDINASIGASLAFGLTGGDEVTFTTVVNAIGTIAACPADLSGDNQVSSVDLGMLMGAWGMSGPSDLNADGTTDSMDMSILLGAWGACS